MPSNLSERGSLTISTSKKNIPQKNKEVKKKFSINEPKYSISSPETSADTQADTQADTERDFEAEIEGLNETISILRKNSQYLKGKTVSPGECCNVIVGVD